MIRSSTRSAVMEEIQQASSLRGYVFACTKKSQKECFDRMLFSTNKLYEDKVLGVKKGDLLFLLNIDSHVLYGAFNAKSDGRINISPEAWGGKYPFQVDVEKNGEIKSMKSAEKILSKMGISWKKALGENKTKLLLDYLEDPNGFSWRGIVPEIEATQINDKPRLEATTLWDYPRQSYGKTLKGNNKYAGVTPAFIIYNLVKRYTGPNDLVVDPMAGSGTTLDVCKEEGRMCIAYDIVSTRPDIIQNDARKIPLSNESVDMIFIDSPYGDNIDYNDHMDNIGNISSETERFYEELEKVIGESHRILKSGKVLGWLIGDQWVKKRFTPVGFNVHQRLCKYFDTVDIICVARRSQTSNTGIWYNRALRFNFYLRGFKYLFIMRKPQSTEFKPYQQYNRVINWARYSRGKQRDRTPLKPER
jgi:DNA modification methylase